MVICEYRKGHVCYNKTNDLYLKQCLDFKCEHLKGKAKNKDPKPKKKKNKSSQSKMISKVEKRSEPAIKEFGDDIALHYFSQSSPEDISNFLKEFRPIEPCHDNIEQYKTFSSYLFHKTTEILDKFCFSEEEFQYLIIKHAATVSNKSGDKFYINLCLIKNRPDMELSDEVYTLTELKDHSFSSFAPRMRPFPYYGLDNLIIFALFGQNLSSIDKNEMIPLDKAIEVYAQTSRERAQIWKDPETNTFRWNVRRFYITHVLVEEQPLIYKLTLEEEKMILEWYWSRKLQDLQGRYNEIQSRFSIINQPIIHNIFGEGTIVELDEKIDRIRISCTKKETVIGFSQSLAKEVFYFKNEEVYQDYLELKALKEELEGVREKMLILKHNNMDRKTIGRLMLRYSEWERVVEEYNELFPLRPKFRRADGDQSE